MRELRGKITAGGEAVVEVEFYPGGQKIEFLLDTAYSRDKCKNR